MFFSNQYIRYAPMYRLCKCFVYHAQGMRIQWYICVSDTYII